MTSVVRRLHHLPDGRFAPDEKVIALTFDDGPGRSTEAVVGALARFRVPATFFVIGSVAEEEPGMVAAVAQAGHTVGGHSWSHPRIDDLTDEQLADEGVRTAAVIEAATGAPAPWFRPPYRPDHAPRWQAALAPHGIEVVAWSVDPRDWEAPDPLRIATAALDHLHPGAIVLLHDGGPDRSATVAALPTIIEGALLAGYRFVAL
jgi:peptidoglycan/xylan/chitin deacetylase (PgdA/CDA1 family)